MTRISELTFEKIDGDLRNVKQEYDKELGGSGFVRVLAHRADVFKDFINYEFPLISETRDSIDMHPTELYSIRVAEKNGCHL